MAPNLLNPTGSDAESKLVFGISAWQVTSATRARWSQHDIATFQKFAQGLRASGMAGSFAKLPPDLDIIGLVQDLDLLQFWDMHNTDGQRLGPILKKKIVRKFMEIWNDLPVLFQGSAAVRTSTGRTRLRTYALQLMQKRESTQQHIVPQGLEMDLIKNDNSLPQFPFQGATKRRIVQVPILHSPPSPEELARRRARNVSRNEATTVAMKTPSSATASKTVANLYGDLDGEEEDTLLENMKKDLDHRWNKYVE